MKPPPSSVSRAGQRLQRVEDLLDQALLDMTGKGLAAPCTQSADILKSAFSELHSFATIVNSPSPSSLSPTDRLALGLQLKSLLPRLMKAERLLHAAAEFYRGWCAAAPPPAYPTSVITLYEVPVGPVLLAFEG